MKRRTLWTLGLLLFATIVIAGLTIPGFSAPEGGTCCPDAGSIWWSVKW